MGLCITLHYFEDDSPGSGNGKEFGYYWDKPYFAGGLGRNFLLKMQQVAVFGEEWIKPDWWKVHDMLSNALVAEVRGEFGSSECCLILKHWQIRDTINMLEAIEELHNEYDIEKVWAHISQ